MSARPHNFGRVAKAEVAVNGSLDECRPVRKLQYDSRCAVIAGEQAFIRGWLAPLEQIRIRNVSLYFGRYRCDVPFGFERPDVANTLNRRAAKFGFEGSIRIPNELVYETSVSLRAVLRDGRKGFSPAVFERPVYVASALEPAPIVDTSPDTTSRVRLIEDSVLAAPLHGRSRRSARAESALEVHGWIFRETEPAGAHDVMLLLRQAGRLLGAFRTASVYDGEATAVAGYERTFGFRARLNVAALSPGLYSLSPALRGTTGTWHEGVTEYFERCVPYEPAPRFLPVYAQPARGHVSFLHGERIRRGMPLAVEGWAADPLTGGTGLGVFARLDDFHFLPLPSGLPNLDTADYDVATGFSGIVDTEILLPGRHRLDLAVFAASGAGWYALQSHQFEVTA